MPSHSLRRWLTAAAIFMLLLAAYTAFGFLGVPRLLRSQLHSFVSSHYSRPIMIGAIHFNPFALSLEVRDLSLPDRDGRPMLGFGRLFVNLGSISLWRLAPSFQEIAVEAPFAHVLIRPDGSLNIADLAQGFAPRQDQAPPPAKPLRLFIDKLSVRSGRTVYEDRSRPDLFIAELTPITFDLRDFSTTAHTGNRYALQGVSEAGEKFSWSGNIEVHPLASHGHFAINQLQARTLWNYARESLGFEVASGVIGLAGDYELTAASALALKVDVHELTVANLGVRPRGAAADYVGLTKIAVRDTRLDLTRHCVEVGKVQLAGGEIRLWRDAHGSINLLELAKAPRSAPAAMTESVPSNAAPSNRTAAASATGSVWKFAVPDIAIEGLQVFAEDRQITPTVALDFAPLNIHVAGYTSAPDAQLHVEAAAVLNKSGKLRVRAEVAPGSGEIAARTELTGLDLTRFQPYVAQQTSMTLLRGVLGSTLAITRAGDGPVTVRGEATITDLRTVDNALQKDFIKWNELTASGIDFQTRPARLRIKEIDTQALYARVIIAASSMLNITEVLTAPAAHPPSESEPRPELAPTAATGASGPAAAGSPLPVSIGLVRISDGSAHFADYSIQPNYAVAIQSLHGSIAGLSSDPASRAKLKLQGNVDRYAPVNIDGEINLLAASAYSDVRMSFKGVEMSSVTPYSGRFAGYTIQKGKLSADLTYHIEQRQLKADHHIVIEQLQLGDRVESPDATKLPLKLAIALLKDRNGVIDLGLPVTGSLDDPQFRLGPLLWKIAVNLVTRAATAPFALLGRLFGGKEDMNLIDFKPGSALLEPAAREKLESLAKGMHERPQLQLDLPMVVSPELDRPALARRELDRKLLTLQHVSGARKPPQVRHVSTGADATKVTPATEGAGEGAQQAIPADPAEQYNLLMAEFRQDLGKNTTLPDSAMGVEAAKKTKGATLDLQPAIAQLQKALLAHIEVPDSSLEELGKRRGRAMQEVLLESGGIEATRIFLVNASAGPDSVDVVRAQLQLK